MVLRAVLNLKSLTPLCHPSPLYPSPPNMPPVHPPPPGGFGPPSLPAFSTLSPSLDPPNSSPPPILLTPPMLAFPPSQPLASRLRAVPSTLAGYLSDFLSSTLSSPTLNIIRPVTQHA